MKKLLLLLLAIPLALHALSQHTRHIIQLSNKGDSPFSLDNPGEYLSQRAIERRQRYGIAIDSTDLPVTPRYIDSIRLSGNVTVLNVSKWLNSVTIQTTDNAALLKIQSFPFVSDVTTIAARVQQQPKFNEPINESESSRTAGTQANHYNYGSSNSQITIHKGQFLHNIGLRGQNVLIGMLDAGYFNYTTLRSFDSVNADGRVIDTWDFVTGNSSVAEDHPHGMQCFSIIAANIPGTFVGAAPEAMFQLLRTEFAPTEYPIEEHNWVCGAERVDSIGGDLISSSLGYTTFDDPSFNYEYADLDGNTTIAVKGADLAAKKGILVFNSAGNEGSGSWHFIGTPADGDSVVAVAAVTHTGAKASFSSFGPAADGRVKPDLASVGQGTTLQLTSNNIGTGNGTSFSCPNMAGLAACLWQGFPEVSNMRIVKALKDAGNKATNPDDSTGYGIPDMKLAFHMLLSEFATMQAGANDCANEFTWQSKDVSAMRYVVERQLPGEAGFTELQVINANGGDILSIRDYAISDPMIVSGTTRYRIRQITDTASATQSHIFIDTLNFVRTAPCPSGESEEFYRIFPNPAGSNFTLSIQTENAISQLRIRITDIRGIMVWSDLLSKPEGLINFQFPIHQLAAGTYHVSIYDGEKRLAVRELIRLPL